MKKLTLSSLVLMCSSVVAAEKPALHFSASTIGTPPLSLLESTKQNPLQTLGEATDFFRSVTPNSTTTPQRVSRMPIIAPKPEIDYKLRIKKPDESIDYKMVVKTPDIESVR
jgi:hypothetical protein